MDPAQPSNSEPEPGHGTGRDRLKAWNRNQAWKAPGVKTALGQITGPEVTDLSPGPNKLKNASRATRFPLSVCEGGQPGPEPKSAIVKVPKIVGPPER